MTQHWHRGDVGMGNAASYWTEREKVYARVWRSNVARGTWQWSVVSFDGRRRFGGGEAELLATAKRAAERVLGGGASRRRAAAAPRVHRHAHGR